MRERPFVLTMAGLDPSGGAGLLADIKTFEALGCQGLAVCTANTVQHESHFEACHWTDVSIMEAQLNLLFDQYPIGFVKIGIVENARTLNRLLTLMLRYNSHLKVILDPVLGASAGHIFHDEFELENLLDRLYLITPNYLEIQQLFPQMELADSIASITKKTNLLLKGGHRKVDFAQDELYTVTGEHCSYKPQKIGDSKHGSGCVLASAITAHLANGTALTDAIGQAKIYTEGFLTSSTTLLGYHYG